MLVGGVLATTGYALAPVATREKMLYIGSIATADDLGQRDFDNIPTWCARPSCRRSRRIHSGNGPAIRATSGSASSPRTMPSGTKPGRLPEDVQDCGGKIVQKIWPPIGTKDFGPYIPTIKGDIDAIFALMVGPMSLQFPKQLRASGNKKPILGGGTNYDEFILPSMDDERDRRRLFVHVQRGDRHAKEYGLREEISQPRRQGAVVLLGGELHHGEWIDETMKKHGGKYPGPLPFIKTMQGIKLDAVRGPVSLDDRLTAVNNIYIKKVEEEEDVRLRQGRALEHGDQDLSERQPVLDL